MAERGDDEMDVEKQLRDIDFARFSKIKNRIYLELQEAKPLNLDELELAAGGCGHREQLLSGKENEKYT